MRFNNLDLNLLVALDLLLAEQNVSRAAERLNVTQSAMSNALARLRDYFGDELLVSVGRRMELTPRAELLKVPVRDILVRIEASVTAAPEFDPYASGRIFKIYVSDYTLITLIPRFMRMIAAKNYTINFEFLPQTSQPHRTLEQGEADILIIPEDFASKDHPTEVLYEESFVCIVDRDHPRIGNRIDREQFASERHAVMKPASTAISFEAYVIARHGIERDIDVTTYSFASLPYLVAGTERIATIHRRLAEQAATHLPLKLLEIPIEIPPMKQSIQWHSYRSNDPALSWLRKTFLSAARSIAG